MESQGSAYGDKAMMRRLAVLDVLKFLNRHSRRARDFLEGDTTVFGPSLDRFGESHLFTVMILRVAESARSDY